MSDEDIIAAIAAELEVAPEAVRLEGEFDKDYGIDSLDFVRLVMAVEVAAGVRIEDEGRPPLEQPLGQEEQPPIEGKEQGAEPQPGGGGRCAERQPERLG